MVVPRDAECCFRDGRGHVACLNQALNAKRERLSSTG